jgi:hypothetical protein
MTHREIILYWLTLGFEVALCALVYFRSLQRRLPFFSVYVTILLICTLCVGLVYGHFGFQSSISYYAGWIVVALTTIARSGAIAELCRYRLLAYRGIWALAWRSLSLLALLFIIHAALDARGQPNWIGTYGLTIERDVEISSVLILLALLLIRNYYGLPIEPLQRWIAAGICFFCLVDVVNSTELREIFTKYMFSWAEMKPQVERVNELWNTIRVSASIVSIGIWCYALRKPLPALAMEPELLPAEIYGTLSPAINIRLRAFNDRLLEVLKP